MKPSGLEILFVKILITDLISLVVCSDFLGFLKFNLERMYFPANYPLLPDCLICWHIIICSIFLKSFVFLCYHLPLILFHLWFIWILFLCLSMVKGVSTFFFQISKVFISCIDLKIFLGFVSNVCHCANCLSFQRNLDAWDPEHSESLRPPRHASGALVLGQERSPCKSKTPRAPSGAHQGASLVDDIFP